MLKLSLVRRNSYHRAGGSYMTAESVYYWKKQNDTNIVVIQPLGRREKLCRICFGVVRTLLIMLGTALLTAILTFLPMCA